MGDHPGDIALRRRIFLLAEPAIAIVGAGGRYVDQNEAHRHGLGFAFEELAALEPSAIFGLAPWKEISAALASEGRDAREVTLSKRSGEQISVELTSFREGELIALFLREITLDTQTRDRLRAADRLASIGMLVAGVAHEVNNPIAYVLAGLQFAGKELLSAIAAIETGRALTDAADLEAIHQAITEAEAGVTRVRQLARALTGVSRPDDEAIELLDVRAALDRAITVVKSELRQRARLEREFHQVPLVRASASRLEQVFLNLLINAAQAIPEGSIASNVVRVVVCANDDSSRVTIEVRDTGAGISPENFGKIFGPFFTTKKESHGTGLGLAISRDIVRSLGGELSAASELGRGSTFKINLPAASPLGGDEQAIRILVIDDEEKIGGAFARMLEPEHEVVACIGVEDALRRLSIGEQFAVIFCDVMMPGGGGRRFYERIAELAPELLPSVVFMTGGAFTSDAREFLESIPNRTLQKPLDAEVLESIIRGTNL